VSLFWFGWDAILGYIMSFVLYGWTMTCVGANLMVHDKWKPHFITMLHYEMMQPQIFNRTHWQAPFCNEHN
jgi:hypothetical protein